MKSGISILWLWMMFSNALLGVNPSKTGILLVAFGTTQPEAQKSYLHIEEKVKASFPGTEIRWAYTSKTVRNKLKQQGIETLSPPEALCGLINDGYTHIAVQALHVLPGSEYEEIQNAIDQTLAENADMVKIKLGTPLLYKQADLYEAAAAFDSIVPPSKKANDALVLMGHGTKHPSDIYYAGFQYHLWQKSPFNYLATVEGYPSLENVKAYLKKNKTKTVWLMPFMTIAGLHAIEDMAGDEPDSWKSQLEAMGLKVNIISKGLCEYDPFLKIWINHLKECKYELEK